MYKFFSVTQRKKNLSSRRCIFCLRGPDALDNYPEIKDSAGNPAYASGEAKWHADFEQHLDAKGCFVGAEVFERKLRLGYIRFTQDSIGPRFRDGGSLEETIDEIKKSGESVLQRCPIKVTRHSNMFFTADNRRLHCLKQALGEGGVVTVSFAPFPQSIGLQELAEKMTTRNKGKIIVVRDDRTPYGY